MADKDVNIRMNVKADVSGAKNAAKAMAELDAQTERGKKRIDELKKKMGEAAVAATATLKVEVDDKELKAFEKKQVVAKTVVAKADVKPVATDDSATAAISNAKNAAKKFSVDDAAAEISRQKSVASQKEAKSGRGESDAAKTGKETAKSAYAQEGRISAKSAKAVQVELVKVNDQAVRNLAKVTATAAKQNGSRALGLSDAGKDSDVKRGAESVRASGSPERKNATGKPVTPGVTVDAPEVRTPDAAKVSLSAPEVTVEKPVTPAVSVDKPEVNMPPKSDDVDLPAPKVETGKPVTPDAKVEAPNAVLPGETPPVEVEGPKVSVTKSVTPEAVVDAPKTVLPDRGKVDLPAPEVTTGKPVTPGVTVDAPEVRTPDVAKVSLSAPEVTVEKPVTPAVSVDKPEVNGADETGKTVNVPVKVDAEEFDSFEKRASKPIEKKVSVGKIEDPKPTTQDVKRNAEDPDKPKDVTQTVNRTVVEKTQKSVGDQAKDPVSVQMDEKSKKVSVRDVEDKLKIISASRKAIAATDALKSKLSGIEVGDKDSLKDVLALTERYSEALKQVDPVNIQKTVELGSQLAKAFGNIPIEKLAETMPLIDAQRQSVENLVKTAIRSQDMDFTVNVKGSDDLDTVRKKMEAIGAVASAKQRIYEMQQALLGLNGATVDEVRAKLSKMANELHGNIGEKEAGNLKKGFNDVAKLMGRIGDPKLLDNVGTQFAGVSEAVDGVNAALSDSGNEFKKSFSPMQAAVQIVQGNFFGLEQQVVGLISRIKGVRMTAGSFAVIGTSVMLAAAAVAKFVASLHDAWKANRLMASNNAAQNLEMMEKIQAKFNDELERERMVQQNNVSIMEKKLSTMVAMREAQYALAKAEEMTLAKSDEERQIIEKKYELMRQRASEADAVTEAENNLKKSEVDVRADEKKLAALKKRKAQLDAIAAEEGRQANKEADALYGKGGSGGVVNVLLEQGGFNETQKEVIKAHEDNAKKARDQSIAMREEIRNIEEKIRVGKSDVEAGRDKIAALKRESEASEKKREMELRLADETKNYEYRLKRDEEEWDRMLGKSQSLPEKQEMVNDRLKKYADELQRRTDALQAAKDETEKVNDAIKNKKDEIALWQKTLTDAEAEKNSTMVEYSRGLLGKLNEELTKLGVVKADAQGRQDLEGKKKVEFEEKTTSLRRQAEDLEFEAKNRRMDYEESAWDRDRTNLETEWNIKYARANHEGQKAMTQKRLEEAKAMEANAKQRLDDEAEYQRTRERLSKDAAGREAKARLEADAKAQAGSKTKLTDRERDRLQEVSKGTVSDAERKRLESVRAAFAKRDDEAKAALDRLAKADAGEITLKRGEKTKLEKTAESGVSMTDRDRRWTQWLLNKGNSEQNQFRAQLDQLNLEGDQRELGYREKFKASNRLTAMGLGGDVANWSSQTAKNTKDLCSLSREMITVFKGFKPMRLNPHGTWSR